MNPFHAGRTPLPDNLKALFRQITMVVPDTMFIAEILLYSVGFSHARKLAFKLNKTFGLIKEQLRFCRHYDFGLRMMKSVLIYAGHVKLRVMKVRNTNSLKLMQATTALAHHLNTLSRHKAKKVRKAPNKGNKSSRTMQRQAFVAKLRSGDSGDDDFDFSAPENNEESTDKRTEALNKILRQKKKKDKNSKKTADNTQKLLDLEKTLKKSHFATATSKNDVAGSSDSEKEAIVEEESSSESDVSLKEKIEELGLDREYLTKELGCDNRRVILNETLLDQYIVLKAIVDKNLPKLLYNDILILQNIVSDVFPQTPLKHVPQKQKV